MKNLSVDNLIFVDVDSAMKLINNSKPVDTSTLLATSVVERFNVCLLDRYRRLYEVLYQINDVLFLNGTERRRLENNVISLIYESAKSSNVLVDNLHNLSDIIKDT